MRAEMRLQELCNRHLNYAAEILRANSSVSWENIMEGNGIGLRRTITGCAALMFGWVATGSLAFAQTSEETVRSLSAPDTIGTHLGTLEFVDGVPTEATASKVYDTLDFTRALNVYNNSFRGASAMALVKGFESIGA